MGRNSKHRANVVCDRYVTFFRLLSKRPHLRMSAALITSTRESSYTAIQRSIYSYNEVFLYMASYIYTWFALFVALFLTVAN